MSDRSRAEWRKSTFSANGSCVEVARNLPEVIAVRDSKDPDGPALVFAPQQWEEFTAGVKAGQFNL